MIHLAFGHHGSPPGTTVGGVCQTGFRKVHVREDPECRLHGVTGRMNIRAPQPQLVPQPPPTAVGEMQPLLHHRLRLRQQRGEVQRHRLTARLTSSRKYGSTYFTNRQPRTGGSPDKLQHARRGTTLTTRRGKSSAERMRQARSPTSNAFASATEWGSKPTGW